jgi:hypothetical protein
MVEKDYWVTHALWAIHEQGFEVWFKGGTSLSKGFGLIERFSEDIDARIDAGRVAGLVDPQLSWNNEKRGPTERDQWFAQLTATLSIASCQVTRNPAGSDDRVRSAWLEIAYPRLHTSSLPPDMRPFVLLEVGRARVVPYVERSLSSWVHEHLVAMGEGSFVDNRPPRVRCIHPWVTCLELLEAIARRFEQGKAAADFVRHYEDAACILAKRDVLPPLDTGLPELIALLAQEDRKQMPLASHPAFNPDCSERWQGIEAAWAAIGPMFWGPRTPLPQANQTIRAFLDEIGPLSSPR